MKRILVLMLVAIAMLMFVSCDNKAEEPAEVNPLTNEELSGKWLYGVEGTDYITLEFTNAKVTMKNENVNAKNAGDTNFYAFYDGDYKIEGDVITFTDSNSKNSFDYSAIIKGDKLTLTQKGTSSMFRVTGHENMNTVTLQKQ